MKKTVFLLILISCIFVAQSLNIARLKYNGGGDWYNDPSSIPELLSYYNTNVSNIFNIEEKTVTLMSSDISEYPMIWMTGHGNVVFSQLELDRLRNYLLYGGFLYIDDDYGMHKYIYPIIKNLFRDYPLVTIENDFKLFKTPFLFDKIPKIHEHDNKPPVLYGIFIDKRLVLLYSYECNISDGWASPDVHKNPPNIREKALKFGCNILHCVFNP
ncbi:MAG: DUF4159 domain-containing protein [Candidatus Muirbacterium halophilum]|nr:DUF4159 domain-containing protein [Candidatus Muirbacterium halophilum]MCK9476175.1 DUF4159 domain-containing protein [Candidatus Muirbacterium halophilum]